EDHRVEPETYTISESAASRLNAAFNERRRIIAVGTTTTRALESAVRRDGPGEAASAPSAEAQPRETIEKDRQMTRQPRVHPVQATTDLFIYPGFQFRAVGGLVTNFHLPRSSLLMLVSAFGGRDLVLDAYRHAVQSQYRFYSYGDAMLIT